MYVCVQRYAKLAMDHGKHVLVEKPAAASVAEIAELQTHAEKCGVKCMPCHNYIYEPHLWRTRYVRDLSPCRHRAWCRRAHDTMGLPSSRRLLSLLHSMLTHVCKLYTDDVHGMAGRSYTCTHAHTHTHARNPSKER